LTGTVDAAPAAADPDDPRRRRPGIGALLA